MRKKTPCYIFIGISDNLDDLDRITQLDSLISPQKIYSLGIVGLEREARTKGKNLDNYVAEFVQKIRNSTKIADWFKTSITKNITPITYKDHTVLMIAITDPKEPVWYGEEIYIRENSSNKMLKGSEINSLLN